MTPHLQLQYNSSGGNGMYGVGWSMNLGSIRRDTRLGLPEYDGVSDVFVYTMPSGESGTLVEDPNDLGTYYQQNSTSYIKFEYNDALDYWSVTDSYGTKYIFGQDYPWNYPDSPGGAMAPDSRINHAEGTYAWLVERVENTLGHRILYRYWADGMQRYPDRIYYTESPNAGDTRNRIEFDVATRPRTDIINNYRNGSGSPITTQFLIDGIAVLHDDQLVREYNLYYDTTASQRARLNFVEEVASDGTHAPTRSFTYNEHSSQWFDTVTGMPWYDGTLQDRGVRFGDVNGDGLPDAVLNQLNYPADCAMDPYCADHERRQGVYLNDGDGTFTEDPGWILPLGLQSEFVWYEINGDVEYIGGMLLDMNGDGLADLVNSVGVYFSDGQTFVDDVADPPDIDLPYFIEWVKTGGDATPPVDVDGDGLTDFLGEDVGGNYFVELNRIWYNEADNFRQIESNVAPDLGEIGESRYADFNGDGLTDVLSLGPVGQPTIQINTGNNRSAARWYHDQSWSLTIPAELFDEGAMIGDFNGDGMADMYVGIMDVNWQAHHYVYWSTGTSFEATPTTWQSGPTLYNEDTEETNACFSQDLNGDGLDDIYCGSSSIYVNQFGSSNRCNDMPLNNPGTDWWDWNDSYSTKGLKADAMLYAQSELGSTVVYCTKPSVEFDNPEAGSSRELLHEVRYHSDEATFEPYDYRAAPAESWARYSYLDGWFSPETRRFAGFRETYSVNSAGYATHTEYHQGDGVADNGVADTWQLAGRPWHREIGTFGNQYGSWFVGLRGSTITWDTHDRYGGGVYRGSANAVTAGYQYRTIRESFGTVNAMNRERYYSYDPYFNVTVVDERGDTSTGDDNVTTAIDYTVNTAAHILRTPSEVRIYSVGLPGGGDYANPAKFVQILYDGHADPSTPPDHGLVTERGVLLDTTGDLIRTRYQYAAPDQALSSVSRELELDVFHDIAVSWDASTTYVDGWSTDVAEGKTAPLTLQYNRKIDTALGVVLEEKLPNERMFYYWHDGLGRTIRVLSSAADNPAITETLREASYDFLGYDSSANVANAVRVRDYFDSGRAVERAIYFDGFGRTRQVRNSTEAAETARVAEVEYQWGRLFKRSNPYFGSGLDFVAPDLTAHPWTEYQYDQVGRTTHVIQPDGAQWRRYYDYLNVESVDPVGDWARHERDLFGRTVLARQADGNFIESTQQYDYDFLGRLVDTADSNGNHTLIDYDSLDRRVLLDDPAAGLVEHVWGYQGIAQVLKESGAIIDYEHDELGRTIEKRQSNPDPAHVNYTVFEYDGSGTGGDVGQLTFTESFDGLAPNAVVTDLYYYDLWGRATDLERHQRGVNGGNAHTLAAQYNLAGQLTRLEYPNGQGAVAYGYNDAGMLEEVYEDNANFTYARASDSWMQYNEVGQINELEYENGVSTNWSYDSDTFRIDRIVSAYGGGPFQDLQYSYSADGNVSGIIDSEYNANDWESMTQDFTYDGLNRLQQASGSYGVIDYSYDKIGNLTQVGPSGPYDETYAYSLDKPHAPVRMESNVYADPTTWSYDADGNVATKRRGADRWDYDFTDDGRLHHVRGPNKRIYAFRYDHTGQRILKKKIGGQGGNPLYTAYVGKLYEQQVANGTTTHVKHVFGFGKLLATVRDNDPLLTEFIHQDLRGTPNEVTDINGNPMPDRRVRHTPFGRETDPGILSDQQTIRFTGQEHDGEGEIGLEYFNARYYDSDSRHFVSPDPLISRSGDTQGWNRFAYVQNNPMTWMDPTGLKITGGTWSDEDGDGEDDTFTLHDDDDGSEDDYESPREGGDGVPNGGLEEYVPDTADEIFENANKPPDMDEENPYSLPEDKGFPNGLRPPSDVDDTDDEGTSDDGDLYDPDDVLDEDDNPGTVSIGRWGGFHALIIGLTVKNMLVFPTDGTESLKFKCINVHPGVGLWVGTGLEFAITSADNASMLGGLSVTPGGSLFGVGVDGIIGDGYNGAAFKPGLAIGVQVEVHGGFEYCWETDVWGY